jgi:hypothetical protein
MRNKVLVWGLLSLALGALGACAGSPSDEDGDEAHVLDNQPIGVDDGKADGSAPAGETVRLVLDNAAFPGTEDHPNAVVYIPTGFDPSQLNIVVYLHGWYNCAANTIKAKNGTCAAGHVPRNAYNLAGQLEASKKNAILIVPELSYEMASSDPGHFAEQDVFYNMLDEIMTKLGEKVGNDTIWDANQIIVSSHSGGYIAAAGVATVGGAWVNEIWLLDSLYGNTTQFDGWVQSDDNHDQFTASPPTRRLAVIYTAAGGTLYNAQAMAVRAKGWFTGTAPIVDDRSGATLTDAKLETGLVFKRSGLGHDDVPRYYFGRLLSTSTLPDKP